MYLGEIIRLNCDLDKADSLLKVLELFPRIDYLHAENELELYVASNADHLGVDVIITEVEEKMVDHLKYILMEYGITLNPDHNASVSELYVLANGIEDLTKYENVEEFLDIAEAQEDDVERLVACLDIVVKETQTGNLLDYYNIVAKTSEGFWKNLKLVAEGTKEEIVDWDAGNVKEVNPPNQETATWTWITDSGRTGYNLSAAYNYLVESYQGILGDAPNKASITSVLLELLTLVHYSDSENDSRAEVADLLEDLSGGDVDVVITASGILPTLNLWS